MVGIAGSNPAGVTNVISFTFLDHCFRPAPLRSRSTIEQAHGLLQLRLGDPGVDRGRLDVAVAQVLLDFAKVAAGDLQEFDAAGVPQRMRVQALGAVALADGADDLVDPAIDHATLERLAAAGQVASDEHGVLGTRSRAPGLEVLGNAATRSISQRHGLATVSLAAH